MIRKGGSFSAAAKADAAQKQVRQMQSSGRDDHAQSITKTPALRVAIFDLSFADVAAMVATNRPM
jgi:hypothetical protein